MSTDSPIPSTFLAGGRVSFRVIGDPYLRYQEKRRCNALQRQKAARLLSSNRARELALESLQQEYDRLSVGDEHPEEESPRSHGDATEVDSGMEPSTSQRMSPLVFRVGGRVGRGRGHRTSGWRRQQGQAACSNGVRTYGQRYGNELMQPEWMTDIPVDLATNWLVMPRPEGMRCLLVTSRGRTMSWLRNGAPLHRFHSPLPGGSPATVVGSGGSAASAASAGDYCLLDCIFHPHNNTYYVQDLLCWRGYALYDTAAEFRAFWLMSKFQEEGLMGHKPAGAESNCIGALGAGAGAACGTALGNEVDTDMGGSAVGDAANAFHSSYDGQQQPLPSYRIVPLPVRPCTLQGLRAAYGRVPPAPAAVGVVSDGSDPWGAVGTNGTQAEATSHSDVEVDFLRDGLYFLHRQGHYSPSPGNSPLALLWKDLGCSRYLLDTDSAGQPLEYQTIVLVYRADRTVSTEDEPPVVLAKMPEAFAAAMGDKLKPGRLLRFSIREGGITFHEGRPAGADLHYEGPANQRRGRADSFSKILFQRLARTAPITVSMLAAAVTASEAASSSSGDLTCAESAGGAVVSRTDMALE